jgi:hypothetical protein
MIWGWTDTRSKKYKAFFFEKRTKKLSSCAHQASPARGAISKSSCFFFQKEALSYPS